MAVERTNRLQHAKLTYPSIKDLLKVSYRSTNHININHNVLSNWPQQKLTKLECEIDIVKKLYILNDEKN